MRLVIFLMVFIASTNVFAGKNHGKEEPHKEESDKSLQKWFLKSPKKKAQDNHKDNGESHKEKPHKGIQKGSLKKKPKEKKKKADDHDDDHKGFHLNALAETRIFLFGHTHISVGVEGGFHPYHRHGILIQEIELSIHLMIGVSLEEQPAFMVEGILEATYYAWLNKGPVRFAIYFRLEVGIEAVFEGQPLFNANTILSLGLRVQLGKYFALFFQVGFGLHAPLGRGVPMIGSPVFGSDAAGGSPH